MEHFKKLLLLAGLFCIATFPFSVVICQETNSAQNETRRALFCPQNVSCNCYHDIPRNKNVIDCSGHDDVPDMYDRRVPFHIYIHQASFLSRVRQWPFSGLVNHALEEVDFRYNNIASLQNSDLASGQQNSIRVLRLDYNDFSAQDRIIGDRETRNLTLLSMSHNSLQGNPGYSPFEPVYSARRIDWSYQQNGIIPRGCLSDLPKFPRLEALSLSGNRIEEGIRQLLGKIKPIRELYVEDCKVEELPIFSDTPKLTVLHIGNNSFRSAHHEHFPNIELKELSLSNNRLQQIDNETFCMPSLESLDLHQNSTSWKHVFDVCILTNISSSLEKLFLENVYINCDCRFLNLRTQWRNRNISLGASPICASTSLPGFGGRLAYDITDAEYIKKCPVMQYCTDYCGSKPKYMLLCPKKDDSTIPCYCYRSVDKLEPTMDCSAMQNPPSDLSSSINWHTYIHHKSSVYDATNLLSGLNKTIKVLSLKGGFWRLDRSKLHETQPNLEKLLMSETRYDSRSRLFEEATYLEKLKTIDLSKNLFSFRCSYEALLGAPNLETLNVSYATNGRDPIDKSCFIYVNRLPIKRYFHDGNKFAEGITDDMVRTFPLLEELHIVDTNTEVIPDLDFVKNLKILHVGGRSLKKLDLLSLRNGAKLREFKVRLGHLEYMDRQTFCGTTNLTVISIENVAPQLTIEPCVLSAVNSTLTKLHLSNTSIVCNCEFYTLRSFWRQNRVTVSGVITCSDESISGLIGRNAMKVSDAEFGGKCPQTKSCRNPCLPKLVPTGTRAISCPKIHRTVANVDCICYYDPSTAKNVIDCSNERRVFELSSTTQWHIYKHSQGKLTSDAGVFHPYPFEQLPKTLEVIDLSFNHFNALPGDFYGSNRATIRELIVDHNNIANVNDLGILEWTALKSLSIENNSFTKCVSFPLMPNLEKVNFASQRSSVVGVECLATLKNVTHVKLNNNRLKYGPSRFTPLLSFMTKLQHLELSNTHFAELHRQVLYRNPLVQALDLSNNPLIKLYNYQFINTPKLQTLSLKRVDTALIKPETFCSSKIEDLNLLQMKTPLPRKLSICALDPIKNTLKQLNLENTTITCNCRFLGLRRIWQRRNVMRGQSPVCGPDSPSSLRNRPAMEIPDGEYSRLCPTVQLCPKICLERPKDIKLTRPCPSATSDNKCHCYELNGVATLDCFKETTAIEFKNSHIEWIKYKQTGVGLLRFEKHLCANIPTLRMFDLSDNTPLSRLEMNFTQCLNLLSINVSNTDMSNAMTEFQHPTLEIVDLRRTVLTNERVANMFTKTPILKYLDISDGKGRITKVPQLIHCRQLRTFKLELLNIDFIEDRAFNTFKKIKVISLAGNKGIRILAKSFCGIEFTLQTLNLNNTNARIDLCHFSRFTNLKNMYLNSTITDCYCNFFELRSKYGHYVNASRPRVVCENPEQLRGRYAFRVSESEVRESCKPGTFQPCADVCNVDTPPPPTTVTPPRTGVAIGPIVGIVVALVIIVFVGFGVAAFFIRRTNKRKPLQYNDGEPPLPPAYSYGVEQVNTAVENGDLAPPVMMTSHGNVYAAPPVGLEETTFSQAEAHELEKKMPPEYFAETRSNSGAASGVPPPAPVYNN